MQKLILFFTLIIAYPAQAAVPNQFLGLWQGPGKIWGSGNWNVSCDQVDYEASSTETQFNLGPIHYACSDYEQQWAPFHFEIRGSELWLNGTKAGTYSQETLHVDTIDPKSGFRIVFDLTTQGDTILYYERWYLKGKQEPIFHAHSDLIRR